MNLADLKVHAQMRRRGIEEAHHVRPQERLRDALPGERIGRDHGIGAGGEQVFFRSLFTGTRNDFQVWDSVHAP